MRLRLLLVPLIVAGLGALPACSDDDPPEGGTEGTSEGTVEGAGGPDPGAAPPVPSVPPEIAERGKPEVSVPAQPATEIEVTDLVVGDGEATEPGAVVTAHYVGVGQQSGEEFDSSWDTGPLSFPLDGVIQGWSEGLVGMKVGGRRLLVVPGDLAYGPNPPTPAILPDETLVFVVDLIDVQNR